LGLKCTAQVASSFDDLSGKKTILQPDFVAARVLRVVDVYAFSLYSMNTGSTEMRFRSVLIATSPADVADNRRQLQGMSSGSAIARTAMIDALSRNCISVSRILRGSGSSFCGVAGVRGVF